ncbi:hypothetical protein BO71DRAFT_437496 [Aspergillus ellipticus CBS 707.79]|uniref:C2H2-type domain-containing protein n=1 Tax=Aspergillus ellipticus CBS 707.79 TaxID=1448320 RepID=A0A319DPD9_9EURO|nr:hypothetical protein BO71DRAFT_437496 [Aspergillus ellipticus CBS 707.79]
MSSEDLQWLESYLRHGYDPEAQSLDDSGAYFQSNPYFALPPSSSYTHAHNGPPGSRYNQSYSNERNVRPPGSSSTAEHPAHPVYPRTYQGQGQPPFLPAPTMGPPPGSHAESAYRFVPPKGPKSFPSQSPKPPPAKDYNQSAPQIPKQPPAKEYNKSAPQLPKPVQAHKTGRPQLPRPVPQPSKPPPGYRPASPNVPFPAASQPAPTQGYQPISSQAPQPASSQQSHSIPAPAPAPNPLPLTVAPSQLYNTIPPPMPPMQTSSSAPPTIPPTQAQNSRPSIPQGGQEPNSRPSSVPAPQVSTSVAPHMPPPQASAPAPAHPPMSQPTATPGTDGEPGPAAKKRRIAGPDTPGRPGRPPGKSGRPSMSSQAKAPSGGLPTGGIAAYNFVPLETGAPTDKVHLKHRADIVQVLREEDAAEKMTYDPKSIARDVLIANGRHPTDEKLNHHLFRLRDIFTHVDYSSDLSTFRWDLVDPVDPRDPGPPIPRPRPIAAPAPRPAPGPPASSTPVNNTHLPPPHSYLPSPRPGPHPGVQPSACPSQLVKKPHAQVSFPPRPQPQQLPPTSQATPQPHPRPQPSTPSTPSTSKAAGQGGTMSGQRPRGRPPGSGKARQQAPVAQSPVPYQVFPCGWESCQSQMHNLEVMKKHVYKAHVSQNLICGWKGCTMKEPLPAAQLHKHVKKDHLEAVAWKLGDGPSVPGTGNEASESQSPEPLGIPDTARPGNQDSIVFPVSKSSMRAFNKAHGNVTQNDKSFEVYRAVLRLKEQIGMGMDIGGTRLSKVVRNQPVSHEEELYKHVRTGEQSIYPELYHTHNLIMGREDPALTDGDHPGIHFIASISAPDHRSGTIQSTNQSNTHASSRSPQPTKKRYRSRRPRRRCALPSSDSLLLIAALDSSNNLLLAIILRIDLQEVVQHNHHHGAAAEEDGQTVELVVGDHDVGWKDIQLLTAHPLNNLTVGFRCFSPLLRVTSAASPRPRPGVSPAPSPSASRFDSRFAIDMRGAAVGGHRPSRPIATPAPELPLLHY